MDKDTNRRREPDDILAEPAPSPGTIH